MKYSMHGIQLTGTTCIAFTNGNVWQPLTNMVINPFHPDIASTLYFQQLLPTSDNSSGMNYHEQRKQSYQPKISNHY